MLPPRFAAVADLACALARPRSPLAGELGRLLEARTAGAAYLVRGWARGHSPTSLRRLAAQLPPRSRPIGQVAVVAPGNLFVAAWQAVLEPWLAGNRVTVAVSSRDGGAVAWLVGQLARRAASEAAAIALSEPEGDRHRAWSAILPQAHMLAIWGSDATAAQLVWAAQARGFAGAIKIHATQRAAAVLGCAALLAGPATAWRRLACDILAGDGRGCLSLGQIVWVGDRAQAQACHRMLAGALHRQAQAWPSRLSASEQTAQAMHSAALAVAAQGCHWSARGDGWLLTGEPGQVPVWPGPALRSCAAVRADDLRQAQQLLRPQAGQLAALCTNAPVAVAAELARDLGAGWRARLGGLQAPPADRTHDGGAALAGYTVDLAGDTVDLAGYTADLAGYAVDAATESS